LVELMIVVGIIGMLMAIATYNIARARETAQLNSIANNLRLLEGAKDEWSLQNKRSSIDTVTLTDLTPHIKGGTLPVPVAGETYSSTIVRSQIVATLPAGGTLAGQSGPFTTTSF
jgi:type II secretory pathway pseudopilin PulG